MSSASLREVRAAKAKLAESLAEDPTVTGIGIARHDGGYVIKVNFSTPKHSRLPRDVDGVDVESEVIGAVTAY